MNIGCILIKTRGRTEIVFNIITGKKTEFLNKTISFLLAIEFRPVLMGFR